MSWTLPSGSIVAKMILDYTAFNKGVTKVNRSFGDMVQSMATFIGVAKTANAVLNLAKAAMWDLASAPLEFEKQMAATKAVAAGTAAELEQLGKQALELSTRYTSSAVDIGKAQEVIAKAGLSAAEVLDLLPAVLAGATASGEDVIKVTEAVAKGMASMGVEASSAAGFIDKLTVAANESQADLSDFGTTLKYVGPAARAAGIGLDQLLASAMVLRNAGFEASQAGTKLNNVISIIKAPAGRAAKILEELGVTSKVLANEGLKGVVRQLEEAEKKMGAFALSTKIAVAFGRQTGPALQELLSKGTKAIDDNIEALQRHGAANEMATDKAKNLIDAAKILWNTFKAIGTDLPGVTGTLYGLRKAFESLRDVLVDIASWWSGSGNFIAGVDKQSSDAILSVEKMIEDKQGELEKLRKSLGHHTMQAAKVGVGSSSTISEYKQLSSDAVRLKKELEALGKTRQRLYSEAAKNRKRTTGNGKLKDAITADEDSFDKRESNLRAYYALQDSLYNAFKAQVEAEYDVNLRYDSEHSQELRAQADVLLQSLGISKQNAKLTAAQSRELQKILAIKKDDTDEIIRQKQALAEAMRSEIAEIQAATDKLHSKIIDGFHRGASIMIDGGRSLIQLLGKQAGESLIQPVLMAAGAGIGMAASIPPELGAEIGNAFSELISQTVTLSVMFSIISSAANLYIMPALDMFAALIVVTSPLIVAALALALAFDVLMSPVTFLTDLLGDFLVTGLKWLKSLYLFWYMTNAVNKPLADFADMIKWVTDMMKLQIEANEKQVPGKKDNFANMMKKMQEKIDMSMEDFTISTDKATKSVQKLNDELVNLNTSFRLRRRIADAVTSSQAGFRGGSLEYAGRSLKAGPLGN